MEDLTNKQLKELIRDYKKENCPPFSKEKKEGLIKIVKSLNIDMTLTPIKKKEKKIKKPKTIDLQQLRESKLTGKAKELHEIYNEVDKLIEKNKNILEKIPFGAKSMRYKHFQNYYQFFRNRLSVDVSDSSAQGIERSIKNGKDIKKMMLNKIEEKREDNKEDNKEDNVEKKEENVDKHDDEILKEKEQIEKKYGLENVKNYLKNYKKRYDIETNKIIVSDKDKEMKKIRSDAKKIVEVIKKKYKKYLDDNNFTTRNYVKNLLSFLSDKRTIIRLWSKLKKDDPKNLKLINKYKILYNFIIEEEPKTKPESKPSNNLIENLIENLKLIVSKYNKDEIKKQNLTKENTKNYTNPYFELLEKIENQFKDLEDEKDFFTKNKKLSTDFADVKKNFIRRIKSQLKQKDKEDKIEKLFFD